MHERHVGRVQISAISGGENNIVFRRGAAARGKRIVTRRYATPGNVPLPRVSLHHPPPDRETGAPVMGCLPALFLNRPNNDLLPGTSTADSGKQFPGLFFIANVRFSHGYRSFDPHR